MRNFASDLRSAGARTIATGCSARQTKDCFS